MNLLKELQKTAKTNASRIVEEQDKILASVKENIVSDNNADLEMLKHFGTHEVVTKAKETRDLNIAFAKGEYLSEEDIEYVCNKYALKCLPTAYFKNQVPIVALNDMRKFQTLNGKLLNGDKFLDSRRFPWREYEKHNLFIIAPRNQFLLTERPRDPILLFKESKGVYRIISSWGDDFNFVQRIYGVVFSNIKLLSMSFFLCLLIGGCFLGAFGSYDRGNKESLVGILGIIMAFIGSVMLIAKAASWEDWGNSDYDEPFKN